MIRSGVWALPVWRPDRAARRRGWGVNGRRIPTVPEPVKGFFWVFVAIGVSLMIGQLH